MAVCLYNRNEKTYNSNVQILKDRSKSVIINLTGKGKSFIGFKSYKHFSGKTIC